MLAWLQIRGINPGFLNNLSVTNEKNGIFLYFSSTFYGLCRDYDNTSDIFIGLVSLSVFNLM